jgi:beta-galactosidase/beta-glucuronidase
MRRSLLLTAVAVTAGFSCAGRATAADLTTRERGTISASAPRPEHPRPQLRRSAWKSLNGRWRFGFGAELDRSIRVPFTFEAPLSGIGREREVHERVRYRRTFTVPAGWRGRRVLLHFGAVDHQAAVRVNGRLVGRHRGGYTPFSFDVTGALRPGGRQSVEVAVRDPVGLDADQPLGKQLATGRIFYTRATGIWQTVWLEPVRADHVEDLRLRPDLDGGRLRVDAQLARPGDGAELRVAVLRGGRVVSAGSAPASGSAAGLELAVPDPAPWSPSSPALYDVVLRLVRDGRTLDRARSYTAFRTTRIRNGRFELNGRPYVLRGVLDQGYWPDGVYTAPSDRALRRDVVMAKAYGFNLARKHVKVEDPRWYWHADRLGLLVAQDMPSAWDLRAAPDRAQFRREWEAMIGTLDHHPSVALWIAFNENWGRPRAGFQSAIVDRARALDPSRPVIDASGSVRRQNSDMVDFHDYGEDLARYQVRRPTRARWIGEYGGLTLRVPGHVWGGEARLRRRVRTPAGLLREYRRLTDQVNGTPGLSGFVYTQLYDVERELNGLMTYDRLTKLPPPRIAAVNRGTG